MIDSQIQVGLASFGMSGRIFHAPFIEHNPNFNLKLILERNKTDSSALYPNAKIVKDFDTLIHDKHIDLVVVNTPTNLHFEMARDALLAGKHVVLEKPMTATSKEAEELIKLAEDQKLLIAVYHNKRLEGAFKTIKKLLSENTLGELTNCQISLHRYRPGIGAKAWKEGNYPGAGLLYDLGSHLIDQCLDLFGWPQDIEADLQIQRTNGRVIDYFHITLKYKNFNAVIVSDMLTKENKPSYVFMGTKASFVKYGNDPQEARLSEGLVNWPTLGEDVEENYGILTVNKTGNTEIIKTTYCSYEQFYINLFEALTQNVPLLIPSEQALKVIKMIEWVQASASVINVGEGK